MPNKISLSFATAKDAQMLNLFDHEAHKQMKWWGIRPESKYQRLLRKVSRHRVILARHQGRLIGYLYARIKKEGRLWIEDVYVLPDYRKQRIAKRMITKSLRIWKGIETASLLTTNKNVKVFNKMGFKRVMNYMSFTPKK